ncbi:recombination endonuclease like protein [Ralstonia phage phiRSL1]|uniref:Recombination endonuclease like protein n=1 Tax=Ralstonia phage phiRSL1 TaxID=1980924 RepID=B2ZYA9_9CAUD|nr:recombination endonuclease like protein [Ralstonia phage phiRSL1]BAG41742.1 recombination endonuclease like protein [Ralstonia phage phiRSL1]
MEAVGIGDLHLTGQNGKGALSQYIENPDQMVMNEVQKAQDWARARGVRRIFYYGDVCDTPRMSYDAVMALTANLDRNDDLLHTFILGNHDMFGMQPELGHSLELLSLLKRPHVKIYTHQRRVKVEGAYVNFMPYPCDKFDVDSLNVFHLEVRGAKNDAGRVFDDEKLPRSKAVAVGGHLHTAHRVRNTYFSGNLYQTNFGEQLPKYFHHIQFNSPQDYEIRSVKHSPTYTLHNVVLQSRKDLELIPREKTSLVKLIVEDGADVSAADYAFDNIVQIKNWKTKADLAAVLTEDLSQGQAVTINLELFFSEWVAGYDVDESMRDAIREVRRRVLNGARK